MFYPNPELFKDTELLNSDVLKRWGSGGKRLLCPLLLISLQQIRSRFGRMVILNSGLQQRTLRTPRYFIERAKGNVAAGNQAYADSYSMHKYGKAIDATMLDTPLEKVHEYIFNHPDEFPFIHFIETDVSWLHFDVRNQPDISFWSAKTEKTVRVAKQTPIDWSKLVKV